MNVARPLTVRKQHVERQIKRISPSEQQIVEHRPSHRIDAHYLAVEGEPNGKTIKQRCR